MEIIRLDVPLLAELNEYFKELPKGTKIAIYIDSCSFQYHLVKRLITSMPDNIHQTVVINSDTFDNHRGKQAPLQRANNFLKIIWVSEEIDDICAKKIFNKLLDKNRLNEYLNLIPDRANPNGQKYKEIILRKIRELNDVIEALFYSSSGRGFTEYYTTWMAEHSHDLYDHSLLSQIMQKAPCLRINRPN